MRIFTDASGSGVAGISFVVADNQHNVLMTKSKPILSVDNNTAELEAILFALEEAPKTREQITIISDSTYAINCIRTNNCRDFERETLDLINYHLALRSNYSTLWIKGHKDDGTRFSALNRLADNLAKKSRKSYLATRKSMKRRCITKQKRNWRYNGKERF